MKVTEEEGEDGEVKVTHSVDGQDFPQPTVVEGDRRGGPGELPDPLVDRGGEGHRRRGGHLPPGRGHGDVDGLRVGVPAEGVLRVVGNRNRRTVGRRARLDVKHFGRHVMMLEQEDEEDTETDDIEEDVDTDADAEGTETDGEPEDSEESDEPDDEPEPEQPEQSRQPSEQQRGPRAPTAASSATVRTTGTSRPGTPGRTGRAGPTRRPRWSRCSMRRPEQWLGSNNDPDVLLSCAQPGRRPHRPRGRQPAGACRICMRRCWICWSWMWVRMCRSTRSS